MSCIDRKTPLHGDRRVREALPKGSIQRASPHDSFGDTNESSGGQGARAGAGWDHRKTLWNDHDVDWRPNTADEAGLSPILALLEEEGGRGQIDLPRHSLSRHHRAYR